MCPRPSCTDESRRNLSVRYHISAIVVFSTTQMRRNIGFASSWVIEVWGNTSTMCSPLQVEDNKCKCCLFLSLASCALLVCSFVINVQQTTMPVQPQHSDLIYWWEKQCEGTLVTSITTDGHTWYLKKEGKGANQCVTATLFILTSVFFAVEVFKLKANTKSRKKQTLGAVLKVQCL